MARCLCCHGELSGGREHHPRCLRALFGTSRAPALPFTTHDIAGLAMRGGARMCVPGAQPKLLVRLDPESGRLEPAPEGSTHILKPEPRSHHELPANENLCMNIAADMGLPVPPHGLFRLADGKLCYVIKRFDRTASGAKLHVETLFQLLRSEDKYKASLEDAGRVLRLHARNVGLDSLELFERVLLLFLLGDGDMHLRNLALLERPDGGAGLAPCFDITCTKIHVPAQDDTALSLNGKKKGLGPADFQALAASLKLDSKAAGNSMRRFAGAKGRLLGLTEESQLSQLMRHKLAYVIGSRHKRLFGG